MTTGTIANTYVTAGYALGAGVTTLIVEATGTVGGTGVSASATATVHNLGTIDGSAADGVDLAAGGLVVNGGTANTTALITGPEGVAIANGMGTVLNFGTLGSTVATDPGVDLATGGVLVNGSDTDTAALVDGFVTVGGALVLRNFGTILSSATVYAIDDASASASGVVTNGSTADTAALIQGAGIDLAGAATVTNFGTVSTPFTGYLIQLGSGAIVNGGAGDTSALVTGGSGVTIAGQGTLTNFGTVVAPDGSLRLGGGSTVTNGSAADTTALISSNLGIVLEGGSTIVNFGTIAGQTQAATLYSSGGVLAIEGGSTITGGATGAGSGLLLDRRGGAGTLANLANYVSFASISVVQAADWTFTGAATVASGSTLTVEGTLANAGTLSDAAGADDALTLSGRGVLMNGGAGDTTALIENGVAVMATGRVLNGGTILGATAVQLVGADADGTVANGGTSDTSAYIDGTATGIDLGSAGRLANFGTVQGGTTGVSLSDGAIVNGATTDTTALIEGGSSGIVFQPGTGTVTNFGTILSTGSAAAIIATLSEAGGTVTNGSTADTAALIRGNGVSFAGSGTIANFGTIAATQLAYAIALGTGRIANGSVLDTSALITGGAGLSIGSLGTVANFGTILGGSSGIDIGSGTTGPGSLVRNGSGADRAALIEGQTWAVYAASAGQEPVTVVNYGTIRSGQGSLGNAVGLESTADIFEVEAGSVVVGIVHGGGGTLALGRAGGAGTLTGLGSGVTYQGFESYVIASGATWTLAGDMTLGAQTLLDEGRLVNAGTIGNCEVELKGAVLENIGTISSNVSAVVGQAGLADAVVNLGIIQANDPDGGIVLEGGGTVTNGSTTATSALIAGGSGIIIEGGAGAVTNDGTIASDLPGPGVALRVGGSVVNGTASDRAAVINGIYVAGGAGTVTNFGTIAGTFAAGVELGAGGRVTNGSAVDRRAVIEGDGGVTLAGPGTLTNFGTISKGAGSDAVAFGSAADVLVDEGGAVFDGVVAGDGGTLQLAAGGGAGVLSGLGTSFGGFGAVEVAGSARWSLTGSTTIGVATSVGGVLTVAGTAVLASSVGGTGSLVLDADTTLETGAGFSIARWSIGGTGTRVEDGLADLVYAGTFDQSAAQLTIAGGAVFLDGPAAFLGATVGGSGIFATAGSTTVAGLTLGGSVHWQNDGTIVESGEVVLGNAGASAALLTNQAFAVVDIVDSSGIALGGAAAAANLINAGLIEKTAGSGLSTIGVAVANTGTIAVARGALDLSGAVAGTGGTLALEGDAILELGGAVAAGQSVQFSAGGGHLLLDQAALFQATVAGFGAGDRIDLAGFAATSAERLSYTENGGDTGGTLDVTDGAQAASLLLFGTYVAAGFKHVTDGHGGTYVIYAPPPQTPVPLAAHG